MTKEKFQALFKKCTSAAFDFTKSLVTNDLNSNFRFTLHLNQSANGNEEYEYDRYGKDDDVVLKLLSEEEALQKLYRKGKNPVWIDVHVHKEYSDFTEFELKCSGRYSDDENKMYYNKREQGPFGIKSPILPINFQDGDKFELLKN